MQQQQGFSNLFVIIVLSMLGFLLYANVLNGSFIFDDFPVVAQDKAIRTIHIPSLWENTFHSSRFVAYFTFALNYHVHKLDTFGYHLINVIIHILTSLGVYWLAQLILTTPKVKESLTQSHIQIVALGASLLYLVHPIQTEAVSYITQRFTCLATLFYVVSICCYLHARINAKKVFYIGFALSALLGMFTKQIVVTLPIMIFISEMFFFTQKDKKKKVGFAAFLLGGMCIIPALYSFDVLSILSATASSGSHRGDIITSQSYLMTQPSVLITYLKLLVFPVNQNLLYDFPLVKNLFEFKSLLGIGVVLSMLVLSVKFYSNKRILSFCILWLLITLLVESSIIPIRHVIFEHRMYLPSIGFCIGLSYILFTVFKNQTYRYVCFGLIIILSVTTIYRNTVWTSDIAMWSDVVEKSPHQPRGFYNLGYAYHKKGNLKAALNQYNQALVIDSEYVQAYNNRSQLYFDIQKMDLALNDVNQAIRIDPSFSAAYLNRGVIYRKQNKMKEALGDFSKAIVLNPDSSYAYINRGLTYGNVRQFQLGLNDIDYALKLNPNSKKAQEVKEALKVAIQSTN